MATENISRIASDFESQISGAISVGATSFTLQSVTDKDGNTLSNGTYCFTLDRDNTSKKEYLIGQLDNATKTVSSISSVSTQGVLTANAQKSHRIGANVIISDHSILAAISRIFNGTGTINPAAPLAYTTAPTLSSATQLATKGYVDSVVTGGSVNTDRIILGSQTAGETVSAGQIVYFDETDQKWKLADADLPATYSGLLLGIALGSGTDGNPISDGVLIYGKCDSFSGLTPGSKYYVSSTAGAVSTTESGAVIGFAQDTDTIFVNMDSSGAPTAFVTTSAGAGDAGKGVKLGADGFLDHSVVKAVNVIELNQADSPYTWNKQTGLRSVLVELYGGGGGGGGGYNHTGITAQDGGGGGGGGAYSSKIFSATQLGSSVTVTIGTGGAGGAGGATGSNINGLDGTNGGTTSFGTLLFAYGGGRGLGSYGGGGGGGGSQVATGGANIAGNIILGTAPFLINDATINPNRNNNGTGGAGRGSSSGQTGCAEYGGAAGGSSDSNNGGSSIHAGSGGGGGGRTGAGGTGGKTGTYSTGGGAAGGGIGTGTAGGNGVNIGDGGGGGGVNAGVNQKAGDGGNGNIAGGGGGGGSSQNNGGGGNGGNGGNGFVRITEFY